MAIATKNVLIKAYWLIKMSKRYYTVLQRAYKVIANDLQECGLSKEILL